MNIVLIGYRGSGKTAVGHLLADKLGWAFLDTDILAQIRSGKTIRDIYALDSEDTFRAIESQVVTDLGSRDWHVISTGGGAVLRPDNAQTLKASGKVVWLAASPEVLWERIASDMERQENRPQPAAGSELQEVRAALREREPIYAGWADLVIDTTGESPNEVAEEVIARLGLQKRNPNAAATAT